MTTATRSRLNTMPKAVAKSRLSRLMLIKSSIVIPSSPQRCHLCCYASWEAPSLFSCCWCRQTAFARAWLAVGLVNRINNRIITSLSRTRVQPANSIKPTNKSVVARVSVTPAACMRLYISGNRKTPRAPVKMRTLPIRSRAALKKPNRSFIGRTPFLSLLSVLKIT